MADEDECGVKWISDEKPREKARHKDIRKGFEAAAAEIDYRLSGQNRLAEQLRIERERRAGS